MVTILYKLEVTAYQMCFYYVVQLSPHKTNISIQNQATASDAIAAHVVHRTTVLSLK